MDRKYRGNSGALWVQWNFTDITAITDTQRTNQKTSRKFDAMQPLTTREFDRDQLLHPQPQPARRSPSRSDSAIGSHPSIEPARAFHRVVSQLARSDARPAVLNGRVRTGSRDAGALHLAHTFGAWLAPPARLEFARALSSLLDAACAVR
jgi:hypothetical protein